MAEIVVKEILDAGVHYGHKASRWNPKMRPYIYGRRNQIHIIDIAFISKPKMTSKLAIEATFMT